ncbi:hypothetical protein PN497_07980 [Sphaerospermopsis kisseleviana CS-549]|uniref:Secreted protein n=1 Tax=Sphaerospermopsis kisseleviana CS-549 TaxID=3021783 RepID=A0ABT4ZPH8_9CYAN|nr:MULTISPECIES: hypothetical protein [Sphaerospermopsis]MBD2131783.1 hypothetical protein [Sphaerospermopsis sp. FACHB-1094]MDB9441298.1 hypothetical protein [Sphaerospermopsis kisseleviana CS-549]
MMVLVSIPCSFFTFFTPESLDLSWFYIYSANPNILFSPVTSHQSPVTSYQLPVTIPQFAE